MLTHVQVVHVPVSDQDRAHEFYVGQLGLSVVADMQAGPFGRWLQVAPEGAATSIALVLASGKSPAGSVTGLVLETSDIDADAALLRDRGVALPDATEDMPWARVLRFADPDGNGIALQTPPPPRG